MEGYMPENFGKDIPIKNDIFIKKDNFNITRVFIFLLRCHAKKVMVVRSTNPNPLPEKISYFDINRKDFRKMRMQ